MKFYHDALLSPTFLDAPFPSFTTLPVSKIVVLLLLIPDKLVVENNKVKTQEIFLIPKPHCSYMFLFSIKPCFSKFCVGFAAFFMFYTDLRASAD